MSKAMREPLLKHEIEVLANALKADSALLTAQNITPDKVGGC